MERVAAIIAAAGSGSRMGGASRVRKQFRRLGDRTVLEWSVAAFAGSAAVTDLIVVCAGEDIESVRALVGPWTAGKPISVVAGGSTRQESVQRGLAAVGDEVGWVVVHDGARPFVTPELIERVLAAAHRHGAATAALPVTDTVKRVDAGGRVLETLDRSALSAVQTPQAFRRELLEEAHAKSSDSLALDDCALVEALGVEVWTVEGDPRNVKITTESDLERCRSWLAGGREGMVATGFGFDVHRLVEGRPLILGGVRIEWERGLLGHSDADALTHAVIDALFGAAALGDIGTHFPDTDPRFKGADSLKLLQAASERLRQEGVTICHVDAFVSAEAPRLRPHIPEMRERLAQAMSILPTQVNIKAGTGEGVGPVGRGEVIEARAVATVLRAV